jgi:hypothetical protein
MDNDLATEIRNGIELLISEDKGVFAYEREVTLFALQVWILFPGSSRMLERATLLAGAKLLDWIEHSYQRRHKGRIGSAKLLASLLETDDYRDLYDGLGSLG